MIYEYKTLLQWTNENLNILGKDGWKLIAVTVNHSAILMREIHEEDKETEEKNEVQDKEQPLTLVSSPPVSSPPFQGPSFIPWYATAPIPTWPPLNSCVWCAGTGKQYSSDFTSNQITCQHCHGRGTQPHIQPYVTPITTASIPTVTSTIPNVLPNTVSITGVINTNGAKFDDIVNLTRGKAPEQIADYIPQEKSIPDTPVITENNSDNPSTTGEKYSNNYKTDEVFVEKVKQSQDKYDADMAANKLIMEGSTLTHRYEDLISERKLAHGNWTPAQQKALYKAIAKMSAENTPFVPFTHGPFLYRPELRKPLPLGPLAESVIEAAETTIDVTKKPFGSSGHYSQALAEAKLDRETRLFNEANTGGMHIYTMADAREADKKWSIETFFPNGKYPPSANGSSYLYTNINKVPTGAQLLTGEAVLPSWANGSIEYFKYINQWKKDNLPNVDNVEKNSDGLLDYVEPFSNKAPIEENKSLEGIVQIPNGPEFESREDEMKEYYTLPSPLETVLATHAGYKDSALVTVVWFNIQEVVQKLGDQAPVAWQLEVETNGKYWKQGYTGYAATMADIRDAKQTMLDLASMWSSNKNDLTDAERAEEHIEQDWSKLADAYPPSDWKPALFDKVKRRSPYIGEVPYDDSGC